MIENWARRLLRLGGTLLAAGLLAGTLARFAPGYETDEEQMDPRRSEESRARLRAMRTAEGNLAVFYPRFLLGLVRGDWGQSRALQRPVRELVAERAAVTGQALATGLALGWLATLAAALLAERFRRTWITAAGSVTSVLGLSLPAGLCAFFLLTSGVGGSAALKVSIAVLVYAKVFPYFRNILEQARLKPAVVFARAKGTGPWRVLLVHVLRPSAPQLLALTSVAAAVAVSGCVPLEMILDQPGIGQLAWQAALARDLPLLVVVTWILGAFLMVLNACADGTGDGLRNV
jgi:peptide/nickel transport system permease protein